MTLHQFADNAGLCPKIQTTRSRSPPGVVAQHSAETPADLDTPHALGLRPAEEPVVEALVTAFLVVVLYELLDCVVERLLPNKDDSVEPLRFDGPEEPLGMGVHVWCLVGRKQDLDTRWPRLT